MDLRSNHNYCEQGHDERSQAAREDLLDTVWRIRSDERADLLIAVAKEPPELISHPVERTRCLVFGAQNPTPWSSIYRIRSPPASCRDAPSAPIPLCLPARSESVPPQFPQPVTWLPCG